MNRRRKTPVPDVVCYHCQQCVEKYLKAFIVDRGGNPPYTHELRSLLALCISFEPSLQPLTTDAFALNSYGVTIRYPGMTANPVEALAALEAMRRVRKALRKCMGL